MFILCAHRFACPIIRPCPGNKAYYYYLNNYVQYKSVLFNF